MNRLTENAIETFARKLFERLGYGCLLALVNKTEDLHDAARKVRDLIVQHLFPVHRFK